MFGYKYRIVNLARTTLRNTIGTMTLRSANAKTDIPAGSGLAIVLGELAGVLPLARKTQA